MLAPDYLTIDHGGERKKLPYSFAAAAIIVGIETFRCAGKRGRGTNENPEVVTMDLSTVMIVGAARRA